MILAGMYDKRDYSHILSKAADERHKCYLRILRARTFASASEGSCEAVKNVDLLILGKSVVEHHVEGIQR